MLAHFLREYNINRVFLSLIGFWPYQDKCVKNLLRTFCLLVVISYCPFEILLLYDHRDNVQLIFEACYQLAMSIAFITRILFELLNEVKLEQLYQTIDGHWDIFTNDIEIRVLKEYSSLSRKFTVYYSTLMYMMMSGFIIIPLSSAFLDVIMPLNETRPRFFAIEVNFRVDKEEYFTSIFCYTSTMIVIGINIMVGVDTMYITCTAHACSLFSAVSHHLETIILKAKNNNKIAKCECYVNTKSEAMNEEIIYQEYVICLKKHQLAIKFVDVLNSMNQLFSLCILLLIVAIFSLIGIQIVYVLDQLQEMLRFVFIIMGALMQLMIMCYSSQRLMDESLNVFYRIYEAEWYNFSPRIKSLLIIALYRSTIPCGLMAGNIIPLSMTTYAGVVRTGMSYFTAFLSFKD